jgi:uncharacterized protein (TIGR00255 family)
VIKSMTGYGSATGERGGAEIRVEMRSVNNRYFDFNLKIPRAYMSIEEPLKQRVQKRISRGKIDVFVTLDLTGANTDAVQVNLNLARAYMDAIRNVSDELGVRDDISALDIVRLPDVLKVEREDADSEELIAAIGETLDAALEMFDASRGREGERLGADIAARLDEIERLTALAEERSPVTAAEYGRKLQLRIEETLQNHSVDDQRILTEVAIFADKVAINEETVRLRSHIAELRRMLALPEPIGRKLDFLVQELNREANTIGSKGNDAEMSRTVVDLKAEIEKIREQAQNIE